MNQSLKNLFMIFTIALPLVLLGCGEEPGPAEKAGKKIDRAMQKTTDKVREFSK